MLYFIKEREMKDFGLVDSGVLLFIFIGFLVGRKRGVLVSLYRVFSMLVVIFVFYRFKDLILKLLEGWFGHEKALGIGLLAVVTIVLLIMKIIGIWLTKILEIVPSPGIFGILAGIFGAIYGFLWAAIIFKMVSFLPITKMESLMDKTISQRYVLPATSEIYNFSVNIGQKIFTPHH
jgi:uncharacterized membrane protein required for colicin V production